MPLGRSAALASRAVLAKTRPGQPWSTRGAIFGEGTVPAAMTQCAERLPTPSGTTTHAPVPLDCSAAPAVAVARPSAATLPLCGGPTLR